MKKTMTLSRGKQQRPQRIGLYGVEGVGKSELASKLPDPLFIDPEKGSLHLDVARLEPETWEELQEAIKLGTASKEFKTLVIDTGDWAEKLILAHVLKKHEKAGIEDFGYGKGYEYLSEGFMELLQLLEKARDAGKHVVILAHSSVRRHTPPEAADGYDRYEMKLSKRSAPLLKEWVDALLFMMWDTKFQKKESRTRAVGGKERIILAEHSASWDAKNRHGLPAKIEIETEKGFTAFLSIFTPAAPSAASASPAPIAPTTAATASTSTPAPTESPLLAEVKRLLRGHEAHALAFLLGKGELKQGQTLDALSVPYLTRIKKNPDGFITSITPAQATEFEQQTPTATETENPAPALENAA